jgi:xanthine phosphoribosyltransferase
LKVGSFLNQQIDIDFLMAMGEDIARAFENDGVTKVLTVEASGIAFAVAAAFYLKVPVTFAKKNKTSNSSPNVYSAPVESFTHGRTYEIMIPKEYIKSDDKILIVDDFLACGNAIKGLCKIISDAGSSVVGAASAVEKGFQGGGDALRKQGMKVHSLAIVESMDDGKIIFRNN